MEVHEIIEEIDEDKNNNNTNLLKSNEENNNKKNHKKNIRIMKEDNYEVKELKKGFKQFNKFNQMYKSLVLSKEKNNNKINIIANDNYTDKIQGRNLKKKSNNMMSTPLENYDSKMNDNPKINLPLLCNPTNISFQNKPCNNLNNETPSTSVYTNSTKNNLRNDHNLTEQVSKFRIGLFSANSSSNNNAIIPMLPIKRPVSNFNFGGNQLWENNEVNQDIIKKDEKRIIIEKEEILNKEKRIKNISLNKFLENNKTKGIFKSNDCKNKTISMNIKINNNINLKTRINKFVKEKEHENNFHMKLIEFKKISNHFNTNNNYLLSRNGNKSHSVKKFVYN